jgi:hypothetical protein
MCQAAAKEERRGRKGGRGQLGFCSSAEWMLHDEGEGGLNQRLFRVSDAEILRLETA